MYACMHECLHVCVCVCVCVCVYFFLLFVPNIVNIPNIKCNILISKLEIRNKNDNENIQ